MNYLDKKFDTLEHALEGYSSNPKETVLNVKKAINNFLTVPNPLPYLIYLASASAAFVVQEFLAHYCLHLSPVPSKDIDGYSAYYIDTNW